MFANQSCATISFSRKKYIGSNLSEKITSQSLDLFCTTWLVFWKKSLLMMPSFSSANYDKCHNHTLQSISNLCQTTVTSENIFEFLEKMGAYKKYCLKERSYTKLKNSMSFATQISKLMKFKFDGLYFWEIGTWNIKAKSRPTFLNLKSNLSWIRYLF